MSCGYYLITRGACGYDEYDSFVIWAGDEDEVRKAAAEEESAFGRQWLDPKRSTVELLAGESKTKIILGSFNAG